MSETKKFYALRRGKDEESGELVENKIFNSYDELKPYVRSNPYEARYKSFLTEDEAKVWLLTVDQQDEARAKRKAENRAKREKKAKEFLKECENKAISMEDLEKLCTPEADILQRLMELVSISIETQKEILEILRKIKKQEEI